MQIKKWMWQTLRVFLIVIFYLGIPFIGGMALAFIIGYFGAIAKVNVGSEVNSILCSLFSLFLVFLLSWIDKNNICFNKLKQRYVAWSKKIVATQSSRLQEDHSKEV